jgi:ligand-binding sensor domain-containing protein
MAFFFLFSDFVIAQDFHNSFRHLTIDNGLSHNTVYSILQDKHGFLWSGTRYGLNRYDGFEFRVFLAGKNTYEMAGPTVLSLMEDTDGVIWIGHKDAGISLFNKQTGLFSTFVGYSSNINWKSLTVWKIYQDKKGFIWLCTSGDGLICMKKSGELIEHFHTAHKNPNKRLKSDFVFDVLEDTDSRLWFACSGSGIQYLDLKMNKIHFINSSDVYNLNSYEKSLCLDKKGNLWIGTCGSGLYKFSNGLFTHYSSTYNNEFHLSHNRITDVELDSNQNLWVATDGGGLNYLDKQQNRFLSVLSSNRKLLGLNTDALYQLYFDKAGSLWIGTFNGGLNVHSRSVSPFIVNEQSFENGSLKSVLSIQEDVNGRIWLGTDGEGLLYIDSSDKDRKIKRVPEVQKGAITCLKIADANSLWIGSFAGGLSYYNFKSGSLLKYQANLNDPSALPHNNIWDLEVCPNGDLWIGTLGGGLSYYNKSQNKFKTYVPIKSIVNSISSFQLVDVLLDKNGKYLWAASEDRGLNRLDLINGNFKRYNDNNAKEVKSLSSNKLRCIFQDKAGLIWIGSEFNGLNILDPKTDLIKKINTSNGLSSNVIHSIEQDADGFIWITTQKGLHRIDPSNLNLIDFGVDEILKNNQYNPKASCLLNNGKILFGGTAGYSLVQPLNGKLEYPIQHVIFSDLKVFNQSIPVGLFNDRTIIETGLNESGVKINLQHADKAISIEFTTSDLSDLNKKRFAYQLEGFDKNWNLLNAGEHKAVFSTLIPGNYKLKVKVLSLNNTWSDVYIIPIIVSPPFWKTWWFIIICITLALFLLVIAFRYILKRQKALFKAQQDRSKQEILRLRNENLESEILAKKSEQEILHLQNESLERKINGEKREQEFLKLKNENLEKEVNSKKSEQEILRLRNENLQKEVNAKAIEQEVLFLRNENLAREVEAKQTRLSVSLLQSAHKNQFLNDLKLMVQKLSQADSSQSQSEIRKLIREINTEINQEDYWEQFQFNFDEMHKNFVEELKRRHPQISSNDQRLCCFLRLDLNNREIASILHITVNGVEQTKYRLKKKMLIEEQVSLNEYIKSI